ncbi:hypothetical protein DNTS_021599, partial [Danionella cerebrum]
EAEHTAAAAQASSTQCLSCRPQLKNLIQDSTTAEMATSTASYMDLDQSAFHYDYETLRTTGVILAVVMFVSGILIALNAAVNNCSCITLTDLLQRKLPLRPKFPLTPCD